MVEIQQHFCRNTWPQNDAETIELYNIFVFRLFAAIDRVRRLEWRQHQRNDKSAEDTFRISIKLSGPILLQNTLCCSNCFYTGLAGTETASIRTASRLYKTYCRFCLRDSNQKSVIQYVESGVSNRVRYKSNWLLCTRTCADISVECFLDVKKVIIAQGIGGIFFAIFGGQPMIIILTTVPLAIYVKGSQFPLINSLIDFKKIRSNMHAILEKCDAFYRMNFTVIYKISEELNYDFFAMYACVGLWCQFFLVIYSVTELCSIMKFATRYHRDNSTLFQKIAGFQNYPQILTLCNDTMNEYFQVCWRDVFLIYCNSVCCRKLSGYSFKSVLLKSPLLFL